MSDPRAAREEANRLERLWQGDFGDAYVERNRRAGAPRGPFWREILADLTVASALEIGCNVGANLRWIAGPGRAAVGIDVNVKALAELRRGAPGARPVCAAGRYLPFRDRAFDLVFTMGVLIHQPESSLGDVVDEMVRCSHRYVLCGEYFAPETVEVPYRGQAGALFKRDYGRLIAARHPELALRRQGFLGRDAGWDDVTYWLFERV